jgi:hypothetical protein
MSLAVSTITGSDAVLRAGPPALEDADAVPPRAGHLEEAAREGRLEPR